MVLLVEGVAEQLRSFRRQCGGRVKLENRLFFCASHEIVERAAMRALTHDRNQQHCHGEASFAFPFLHSSPPGFEPCFSAPVLMNAHSYSSTSGAAELAIPHAPLLSRLLSRKPPPKQANSAPAGSDSRRRLG